MRKKSIHYSLVYTHVCGQTDEVDCYKRVRSMYNSFMNTYSLLHVYISFGIGIVSVGTVRLYKVPTNSVGRRCGTRYQASVSRPFVSGVQPLSLNLSVVFFSRENSLP